jgi:hypothetical protein
MRVATRNYERMSALSHSKQLRVKIRLAEPRLLHVSDQFWTHLELAQIFPEFLFMMHSIIRSSVSLINAAAESAQSRAGSDPVSRKIAGYYKTHALEEMHHDDWLLDDLVAIGAERSLVLDRLPSTEIASLVGAQYYWSLEQLGEICAKHGLPADGFRTMIKHAKLDPHHRDEIYAQLDQLPLTENHSELMAVSAFHAIEHISLALEEIMDAQRDGKDITEHHMQAVEGPRG